MNSIEGSESMNLGGGSEKSIGEGSEKSEPQPGQDSQPQAQYSQDHDYGWQTVPGQFPGPYNVGYEYDSSWGYSGPEYWPQWAGYCGLLDQSGDEVLSIQESKKPKVQPGDAGPDMEWVRVEAVMDSGAVDTVGNVSHVNSDAIRKTKVTGMKYTGAGGEAIENKGEGDVQAKSDEGIDVAFTAQIGDKMKRLLIAVNKAVAAGNMVMFGGDMKTIRELAKRDHIDENMIVDKKSMVSSKIHEKRGLYVYPLWVKKKKGSGPIQMIDENEDNGSERDPFDLVAPF